MKNTQYNYKMTKCRSGFQVVVVCTKTSKKYYANAATSYNEAIELADALVITLMME
ncbi:hypothetical protein [Vibrio chagasii]|uniref:hypothetical protein n=1 Tax=Vibrio chagasii TaxID=170679 RepID=UPI001476A4FD|nr:hypothetical protein [Vibrio chagasii]